MSTVTPASSSRPEPAQALELLAQHVLLRLVLVPDEDPSLAAAGREHPEHQALEHEVRLLGQDLAVLEGARLGLVGVADRVLRLGLLLRDQLPLRAGREPGAAHAAQLRLLQLGDQVAGVELAREGGAQHAVVARVGVVRIVGPLHVACAAARPPSRPRAPGRSARCTTPRAARRSGPSRARRAAPRSARPTRAASTPGRGSRPPRARGGGAVRKCG